MNESLKPLEAKDIKTPASKLDSPFIRTAVAGLALIAAFADSARAAAPSVEGPRIESSTPRQNRIDPRDRSDPKKMIESIAGPVSPEIVDALYTKFETLSAEYDREFRDSFKKCTWQEMCKWKGPGIKYVPPEKPDAWDRMLSATTNGEDPYAGIDALESVNSIQGMLITIETMLQGQIESGTKMKYDVEGYRAQLDSLRNSRQYIQGRASLISQTLINMQRLLGEYHEARVAGLTDAEKEHIQGLAVLGKALVKLNQEMLDLRAKLRQELGIRDEN